MTIPSLIAKHQKQTTVNRLKVAYSQLYQAVNLSVIDNGEIGEWDFENVTAQQFFEKYLQPYLKIIVLKDNKSDSLNRVTYTKLCFLSNGTLLSGQIYHHVDVVKCFAIEVDLNGEKAPNIYGKDKFIFYIFPKAALAYNVGLYHAAINVSKAGLYPDGYGFSRDELKTNSYRGCNMRNSEDLQEYNQAGAYCTALIMLDGWKISDDYKW